VKCGACFLLPDRFTLTKSPGFNSLSFFENEKEDIASLGDQTPGPKEQLRLSDAFVLWLFSLLRPSHLRGYSS
jgi:hypothetical protein